MERKTLGDVCDFYRGLTYSKKDEVTYSGNVVLRANNIDLSTKCLNFSELKYLNSNLVIPKDKKLSKNTIFICMSSGSKSHLGKVAFVDKDYAYAFGGFMGLIKPYCEIIIPKYLFYLMITSSYKEFVNKLSNGININNIKFSDLKSFTFNLPSLEEQQRIVNILDKAEEIRTKKKLANEKLDEFIDATFYYRFGNPEANEHSWDIVKLENVCNKITDGVHSKPAYTNIGIPFISVKDITTKKLLFEDCKFISEDDHYKYIKRCNPEYNDILYTKVGATYGRAAIVDTTKPFSLYVSVALLKPKKELINPLFLKAVLNTKYVKTQADKRIKGIGVPDLHLIEIKNFAIPLPPFEQQKQFAQIVQKVEAQKEKNQKVIEQMDNLFNSLMQQAFKEAV